MAEITRAEPHDYKEMAALANYCFSYEGGAMELRWNHVWGGHLASPSKKFTDYYYLLKDSGKITGILGIIPMTIIFAGEEIPTGGITSVSVHPEHRGKGIMSKLLQFAGKEMLDRGYVISVLGGDRFRYGNFGWEKAGLYTRLSFSDKYLMRLPDPKYRPFRITIEHADMHDQMLNLAGRCDTGFRREKETLELLIHRCGCEFWGIMEGDVLSSCIGTFDNTICEYYGKKEHLPGLIKHFALMHGQTSVIVSAPGIFTETEDYLYQYCGSFTMEPITSLRILKFAELMKRLLPAMNAKLHSYIEQSETHVFHPVSLKMKETGETVTLESDDKTIKLTETQGRSAALLSARDMTRLLFGPFSRGIIKSAGEEYLNLSRLFPLPFSLSYLDSV